MSFRRFDLTDHRDHRRRILLSGVHPNREVGTANSSGAHAESRLAGELAHSIGHEGGAALVPGRDERDLRRQAETIQQAEKTLARHAEGVPNSTIAKHLDRRETGT